MSKKSNETDIQGSNGAKPSRKCPKYSEWVKSRTSRHESKSNCDTEACKKAKLPKLSLPRFSGDTIKWLSFWDSFSSAIDDNDELNDVDKFQMSLPPLKETVKIFEADVMIGADYYWSFVQNNVVWGESGDGPVAISTRLGHVLSGPLNLDLSDAISSNLSIAHTMKTECVTLQQDSPADLLLKENLNKYWNYESLGINDGENDMYDNYLKTIKQNKHPYEVSLPMKQDHPVMPDNYISARHRLSSQVRKLKS